MVQLVDEHSLMLGSTPFFVERCPQPLLAIVQILQAGSGLVLPQPSPQGGASDTAENLRETRKDWIALNPAAAAREKHEGEVRPGWLMRQPTGKLLQIGGAEGLVRDERKPAPWASSRTSAGRSGQISAAIPAACRISAATAASRPSGARMSARSERDWSVSLMVSGL
jgi:hypothetical protein